MNLEQQNCRPGEVFSIAFGIVAGATSTQRCRQKSGEAARHVSLATHVFKLDVLQLQFLSIAIPVNEAVACNSLHFYLR